VPKSLKTSTNTQIFTYADTSSQRIFRSHYGKYLFALRNLIIQTKHLYRKFKFSSVLIISDSGIYNLGVFIIYKLYKIPYSIYFFDIWVGNKLSFWNKIFSIILEPTIIKKAKFVIAAGEGIADLYASRYHIKPIIINNPFPDIKNTTNPLDVTIEKKNDLITDIIYTGSVYWPQRDSIQIMGLSVLEANKIILNIYTGESLEDIQQEVPSIISVDNIKIHNHLSEEILLKEINNNDIAFLPLYIVSEQQTSPVIKFSQPGKLATYLISNTPILIHAPEDSYISQYAKKYNFAYVNNDKNPQSLLKTIQYIVNHQEESTNKIQNAYKIGTKFHDPKKNSTILQEYLLRE